MREIWKPIPRFRGYTVSSRGRVRGIKGKSLAQGLNGAGYLFVILCNSKRQKLASIHRLVAKAFVTGKGKEVNHLDGDKRNNLSANLEWTNRSENQRHAADMGLKPSGERSHLCTKLTAGAVRLIRTLAPFASQETIAGLFGISQPFVGKIIRREKWRQLT